VMFFACLLAQADPAALVERLRSDDIEVRERAASEISRLGGRAEPELDAASRDADPEVAARARQLLLDFIAPHRREIERVLSHLSWHFQKGVLEKGAGGARQALLHLRMIDPFHPFGKTLEWHGVSLFATPEDRHRLAGWMGADHLLRGLRYPDRAAWEGMRERVSRPPYDSACSTCVKGRLMSFKLGMSFENARVETVLEYLKDLGDVSLVLDAMDGHLERAVTLEFRDVTLTEAFERVLAPFDLEARVSDGGVVLITRR